MLSRFPYLGLSRNTIKYFVKGINGNEYEMIHELEVDKVVDYLFWILYVCYARVPYVISQIYLNVLVH